jgi:hypothetical protein
VGAEQAEKKHGKETVNQADGLTEVASVVVNRIREKPADLPVQQSSEIAVVINRKAVKALELIIPQPVPTRADEVIKSAQKSRTCQSISGACLRLCSIMVRCVIPVRALSHLTQLAMRLIGSPKKRGGPSRAVAPIIPVPTFGPGCPELPPFHSTRTKVEVPSALLLTTSSFGLNDSIVLVVDLFKTRSSSALVTFNVIDLPFIAQVPPIVPVTPWPSVLLMNPCGRKWDTKPPPALNDIASFMSPTVPIQSPTIFAG